MGMDQIAIRCVQSFVQGLVHLPRYACQLQDSKYITRLGMHDQREQSKKIFRNIKAMEWEDRLLMLQQKTQSDSDMSANVDSNTLQGRTNTHSNRNSDSNSNSKVGSRWVNYYAIVVDELELI